MLCGSKLETTEIKYSFIIHPKGIQYNINTQIRFEPLEHGPILGKRKVGSAQQPTTNLKNKVFIFFWPCNITFGLRLPNITPLVIKNLVFKVRVICGPICVLVRRCDVALADWRIREGADCACC